MVDNRNEFDSTSVFLFIIRWWKHLAIICFVAALGGVIFSSPIFITPKFESKVVMFPASTNSISRAVLGGPNVARNDFLQYGDVEDAERLLQVLSSAAIRDKISNQFDLISHYDIPDDSRYKNTLLQRNFRENIKFNRTKFGAVEITVRDKDPIMAAAIANEIAAQVDSVQNAIRRDRAIQAFEIARKQYSDLQEEIKQTEDSLKVIMRMGIYDIEAQATMLTQQLAIDLSVGNTRGVRAIEERLNVLSEYGGAYMHLSAYLLNISGSLSGLQRRFQEARVDMENVAPFKFVIDNAFEAERKVYPIRWLIVFMSTFAAGFGAIMVIMVYENLSSKGIIKTNQKILPKSS
jgi:hypothetical protein